MSAENPYLQFNSPIPGQSLTTEPKARPWENPATFTSEEEVLEFYINQLSAPDRVQHLVQILESGFPVADLVDGITLAGVMQGLHSIDLAVLVAPTMYELLVAVAEAAEVEYKTGLTADEKPIDSHLLKLAEGVKVEEDIVKQFEEEDLENIRQATGIMSKPENVQPDVEEIIRSDTEEMVEPELEDIVEEEK